MEEGEAASQGGAEEAAGDSSWAGAMALPTVRLNAEQLAVEQVAAPVCCARAAKAEEACCMAVAVEAAAVCVL